MPDIFVRWPQVERATGLSRSTIWRLEKSGAFPARRQLSANAVGWLEADIDDWVKSRQQAPAARPLITTARLRSAR